MTNIVNRIRAAFLRRELAALQATDRSERDQVRTTDDLMIAIIERTSRMVELQNKIDELEGCVQDAHDDDDGFDSRTPSDLFIPTKGKYE